MSAQREQGRRRRCRQAVLSLAVATVPLPALAADRYWVGGGAFVWPAAINWSTTQGGPGGAGQPENGDDAYIISASDLTVTRDVFSPAYAAPGPRRLRLSNTGVGVTQLTLDQFSNALVTETMDVAFVGKSRLLQAGGSNVVSVRLDIGADTGSLGTYDLTGANARLVTPTLAIVGDVGTGVFNQSAGVHDATTLILGYSNTNATGGTYNLSGGTLNTAVGLGIGGGTFNHSGGSQTAAALNIGFLAGATGTYSTSNGASLTVPGLSTFGSAGTGVLNVTGGAVDLRGGLQLGITSTGAGSVNVSGGLALAPSVFLGGTDAASFGKGTLHLTGGAMTVAGSVKSWNANSTITLDGGTLSAAQLDLSDFARLKFNKGTLSLSGPGTTTGTGSLQVGLVAGAAAVNLTGGTLSVPGNTLLGQLGSAATFTHSGGTFSTALLSVGAGSSGTYALSGTAALTTTDTYVGQNGSGTFNQSGGSHAATRINVASATTATGAYNLDGGTVNATDLHLGGSVFGNGGAGSADLTFGTMNVTGTVKIWNANSFARVEGGILNAGAIDPGDWSRLDLRYGLVSLGGSSSAPGNLNVGSGDVEQDGEFDLNGGTLTVGGNTNVNTSVAAFGLFKQTAGTHATANLFIGNASRGTYQLKGGTLTSTTFSVVGRTSPGIFEHTGGAHNALVVLVGDLPTGNGEYDMTGAPAVLKATFLTVGKNGVGSFNQSAGLTSLTANAVVAEAAGATGTINLSGGAFDAPAVYVGGTTGGAGGTGHITLTGGTMTASSLVKVWNAASSLDLNAGVLAAASLDVAAGPASMLSFDGGTWRHTGASATFAHDFTLRADGATLDVQQAATTLTLAGNPVMALFAPLPGQALPGGFGAPPQGGVPIFPGTVTKAGAGTLKLTASLANSAGLIVNAGKVEFANPASPSVPALTVNAGGSATVSAGVIAVGVGTSTGPLSVNGTGRIDLAARGMVVTYPGGLASFGAFAIRGLIVQAYHATGAGNNGDWTGAGITSSIAQADPSRAVGYALASDIFNTADATPDAFLGKAVTAGDVLARLTLAGDANLDGAVDFNDLVRLAQNYNTNVAATGDASWWFDGDFTYDGVTDFNDLVKLAQNYNTALPSEPIPGAPADFDADLTAAFAAVPEPSSTLACVVAAVLLAARRRRRTGEGDAEPAVRTSPHFQSCCTHLSPGALNVTHV
jgi:hypothetical protein